jgi:hypothetical protein
MFGAFPETAAAHAPRESSTANNGLAAECLFSVPEIAHAAVICTAALHNATTKSFASQKTPKLPLRSQTMGRTGSA